MVNRQAIFTDGWERACRLYALLSQGGAIPPAPPTTVRLQPGEVPLIETQLGYERFVGRKVRMPVRRLWRRPGDSVLSNWAENMMWERKGRKLAAPRWTHFANARTVLTTQRLLCDHGGWVVFHYPGVVELRPQPESWWFEVYFNDTDPLRLVGAFAPWCSVALASLLYGQQGLALPGFEVFRQALSGAMPRVPRVPK